MMAFIVRVKKGCDANMPEKCYYCSKYIWAMPK